MTFRPKRALRLAPILLVPLLLGGTCDPPSPFSISIDSPVADSTTCSSSIDVSVSFSAPVDPAVAVLSGLLVEGIDSAPVPTDISAAFVITANGATASIPVATEGRFFVSVNVDRDADGAADDFKTVTLEHESASAPSLTMVTPSSGAPGTLVSLSGSGFCSNAAENVVTFDGVPAVVEAAQPQLLVVTAPVSTTGAVVVEVNGQTSNGSGFLYDATLAPSPPSSADEAAGFVVGEIVVQYLTPPSAAEVDQISNQFGLDSQQGFPALGFHLARVQGASEAVTVAVSSALSAHPSIKSAFPNALYRGFDDPDESSQTYLQDAAIRSSWSDIFPSRGAGVLVAVLDSGLNPSASAELSLASPLGFVPPSYVGHPEVGSTFALEDDHSTDGHGTAVATIVAARENNLLGAGVAPEAEILPVKIWDVRNTLPCRTISDQLADCRLNPDHADVSLMLLWATKFRPTRVANISWGGWGGGSCPSDNQSQYDGLVSWWGDFVATYLDEGVVVVASTGNSMCTQAGAPAAANEILAVGGTADFQTPHPSHNGGSEIAALSQAVSAFNGSQFAPLSGTSFSAPQVSGLAALIVGEFPFLSRADVRKRALDLFTRQGVPSAFRILDASSIRTSNGPWELRSSPSGFFTGTLEAGTWVNFDGSPIFLMGDPAGSPACISGDALGDAEVEVSVASGSDGRGLAGASIDTIQFDAASGAVGDCLMPDLTHLFDDLDGVYRVRVRVRSNGGISASSSPLWLGRPMTTFLEGDTLGACLSNYPGCVADPTPGANEGGSLDNDFAVVDPATVEFSWLSGSGNSSFLADFDEDGAVGPSVLLSIRNNNGLFAIATGRTDLGWVFTGIDETLDRVIPLGGALGAEAFVLGPDSLGVNLAPFSIPAASLQSALFQLEFLQTSLPPYIEACVVNYPGCVASPAPGVNEGGLLNTALAVVGGGTEFSWRSVSGNTTFFADFRNVPGTNTRQLDLTIQNNNGLFTTGSSRTDLGWVFTDTGRTVMAVHPLGGALGATGVALSSDSIGINLAPFSIPAGQSISTSFEIELGP